MGFPERMLGSCGRINACAVLGRRLPDGDWGLATSDRSVTSMSTRMSRSNIPTHAVTTRITSTNTISCGTATSRTAICIDMKP